MPAFKPGQNACASIFDHKALAGSEQRRSWEARVQLSEGEVVDCRIWFSDGALVCGDNQFECPFDGAMG